MKDGEDVDLNMVVLAGKLASKPTIKEFDSGNSFARLLVVTRTEKPRRRVDVVPVVCWDPPDDIESFDRGDRVWVAGAVQRRFWSNDHNSRRSQVEIVAYDVQKGVDERGVKIESIMAPPDELDEDEMRALYLDEK